jgi:very-short-patch-repair endonuclease
MTVFIAGSDFTETDDFDLNHARDLRRRAAIEAAKVCLLRMDEPSSVALLDALYAASRGVPLAVWGSKSREANHVMGLWAARVVMGYLDSEEQARDFAQACIEHSPKGESFWFLWRASYLEVLKGCESPAEARLAVHLLCDVGAEYEVVGQHTIEVSGKTYRLDFAIEPTWNQVAIEVDGHEFHERTKEQAARDKSRDRALQAAGWRVLRFTGSEVWNDPRRCAQEVYNVLERDRLDGEASIG